MFVYETLLPNHHLILSECLHFSCSLDYRLYLIFYPHLYLIYHFYLSLFHLHLMSNLILNHSYHLYLAGHLDRRKRIYKRVEHDLHDFLKDYLLLHLLQSLDLKIMDEALIFLDFNHFLNFRFWVLLLFWILLLSLYFLYLHNYPLKLVLFLLIFLNLLCVLQF